MSDYTKELKESLGFGLVFAAAKAVDDYLGNGRKPSVTSFAKNGAIAAGVDVIYDYGKSKKWWP